MNVFLAAGRPPGMEQLHQEAQLNLQSLLQGSGARRSGVAGTGTALGVLQRGHLPTCTCPSHSFVLAKLQKPGPQEVPGSSSPSSALVLSQVPAEAISDRGQEVAPGAAEHPPAPRRVPAREEGAGAAKPFNRISVAVDLVSFQFLHRDVMQPQIRCFTGID